MTENPFTGTIEAIEVIGHGYSRGHIIRARNPHSGATLSLPSVNKIGRLLKVGDNMETNKGTEEQNISRHCMIVVFKRTIGEIVEKIGEIPVFKSWVSLE